MNRLVGKLVKSRFLFRKHPCSVVGYQLCGVQSYSKEVQNANEPLKYFGTEVEKIRATPKPPPRPTYSPYIVNISLMAFLLYFCMLREENDTDELLKRDLFDHFGDEASRLKKAYDYNIKHNLPTSEILSRLREIGAPVPPGMR